MTRESLLPPFLTTIQMIEVDRLLVAEYHIELIQMMEIAGRNLADLARTRFLEGDPRGKKVLVMAGTGGNGGGVLVCARYLQNWGANVYLALTAPTSTYRGVPAHQLEVLQWMGMPVIEFNCLDSTVPFGLILDGMIGYSLKGAPRGKAADMIRWANVHEAPILALDIPSGLDTSTGVAQPPTIQATATMTLALPKQGLLESGTAAYVGELYLADIGVPPELYASAFGIHVSNLFFESAVIRVQSA